MRWSQSFIPTLRDDPADAEAISHKLLVRAGFIRQQPRWSYRISLSVVYANLCQAFDDGVTLNPFGNGTDTNAVTNFIDGLDHAVVDRIIEHALNNAAIDL